MNRRWLFAVLLVGLLAAGATGGAVLAHNNGGPQGESRFGELSSRVAAILGLDEETVQDAFQQAVLQIRDEALQERLDLLVESGRLTQEQADEYGDWLQSRPDSLAPGLGPHLFGGLGGHGLRGRGHALRGFFHGKGAPHEAPPPENTGL